MAENWQMTPGSISKSSIESMASKSVSYGDFFFLWDPLASRPLRLETCAQEWVKGDTADRLYKGEWQPPEPLLLRGYKGKVPADFQWSSFPPIVCVSQRVLDILNENRFTGWSTYPVSVYGRRGEPLPGYYGFAITGWAGDWDLSQSPVMQKGPLAPGGKTWKVYKGMYFDQTAWNGSDIFRVGRRGAPGYAVVTARVRQAFERAKVTNVKFTPLSELELDTVIFKSRVRQAQDTAQVTKR